MQECHRPVLLPEVELTQSRVESYWMRDRQSLLDCRGRHKGLAEWALTTTQTLKGESK